MVRTDGVSRMIFNMVDHAVPADEHFATLTALASELIALVAPVQDDFWRAQYREFIDAGEPSLAVGSSLEVAANTGLIVPDDLIEAAVRLCDPDDLYDDTIATLRSRVKEAVPA